MEDGRDSPHDDSGRAGSDFNAASEDTRVPPGGGADPTPPEPRTGARFWLKIIVLIVLTLAAVALLGAMLGPAAAIVAIALPVLVDYWSDKREDRLRKSHPDEHHGASQDDAHHL